MPKPILKTACEWWSEIPEDKNYYKNLDGWNEFRQKDFVKEWFYNKISAKDFYGRLMMCSRWNEDIGTKMHQQYGPYYPLGIRQLRRSTRHRS